MILKKFLLKEVGPSMSLNPSEVIFLPGYASRTNVVIQSQAVWYHPTGMY